MRPHACAPNAASATNASSRAASGGMRRAGGGPVRTEREPGRASPAGVDPPATRGAGHLGAQERRAHPAAPASAPLPAPRPASRA
jgi:hypothetical protein